MKHHHNGASAVPLTAVLVAVAVLDSVPLWLSVAVSVLVAVLVMDAVDVSVCTRPNGEMAMQCTPRR